MTNQIPEGGGGGRGEEGDSHIESAEVLVGTKRCCWLLVLVGTLEVPKPCFVGVA